MKKREITQPETAGPHGAFLIAVAVFASILIFLTAKTGHWSFMAISSIPVGILLYISYGFMLSVFASHAFSKSGIRGVLIYSESPNWQEYIECNWLPRLNNTVVILNWSHRKQWKRDLAVRLFKHFVGTDKNFNPAAILLRKNRWPIILRFYPAFRDAKHGDQFALEKLESILFSA